MPDNKPKGMKKKSLGSVRAKAGLPAKAGRRSSPVGGMATAPETRNYARLWHWLTSGPKPAPLNQVRIVVENPHGRAAEMMAEAALRHASQE